ncbi:MAG: glycosyltransferase family 4 protein [Planctomycetes bacterium]|nr:glycosyltransferase family 4 protein [Planctomycetota bacterium]
MRVAYLNPVSALGGAERSLLDLIAALAVHDSAFEPHLVCGEEGPLTEAARAQGVETTVLRLPPALGQLGDSALRSGGLRAALRFAAGAPTAAWAAADYGASLRDVLRRLRPDWIHSNALKTHLLTPAFSDVAPVVWHLRDAIGQRRIAKRLLALAARKARVGIGISSYVVRDARAALGRLPLVAVENAIDLGTFSPQGSVAELDTLAGVPPLSSRSLRLGLVATYGRWKGQDVFLSALGELARRAPQLSWRAYVIGGPIYRTAGSQWSLAELREGAVRAGIGERVAFVPFQADPAPVFRALDVVVHASTRPEPFGRTIAEAMACERALIVARAGGAAELFSEGINALGVTPGEPSELAAALGRLVGDKGLRERLGAQAGRHAASRFDRLRLGHEVGAVYAAYRP